MIRFLTLTAAALVLAVLGFAYGPGAINPVPFHPSPADPNLNNLFTDRVEPENVDLGLPGAEDLEPGPDGRLYVSLSDGRIMARAPDSGWTHVVDTGGRPLGLAFGPEGRLHVADALLGLLRVEPDGEVTVMAPAGAPPGLVFTDDLAVLPDGSVILSDASQRYGYGEYMLSFIEGEQTGRVLRVQPDGEIGVLADGLAFANGIDRDPETGLVFINETWAGRVHALDLETGELSVLVDGLPGYPDNNHWDSACGCLWIAMPAPRETDLEALHARPFVKRLLWRWFQLAGLPQIDAAPMMALAVDLDGEPVAALSGRIDGGTGISGAAPWEGRLWTVGLERDDAQAFAMPETSP